MSVYQIKNICIVGTGAMSAGTAISFSIAGYGVRVRGSTEKSKQAGIDGMQKSLQALIDHGFVQDENKADIMSRIAYTTDLAFAAQDADLVFETSNEELDKKQEIFTDLDKMCPPHTIFGTNTSSLSPTEISQVVSDERKSRFLGLHLFNPPNLMRIAEVCASANTRKDVMDTVCSVMHDIGKDPVRLEREIPGYIVNRVQAAMWVSAYTLLEQGHSHHDIDKAVVETMGHGFSLTGSRDIPNLNDTNRHLVQPVYDAMRTAAEELIGTIATSADIDKAIAGTIGIRLKKTGPIMSCDLTGLDISKKIIFELGHQIPALMDAAVEAGRLGYKTLHGIYELAKHEWEHITGQRGASIVAHCWEAIKGTNHMSAPVRPDRTAPAPAPVMQFIPAK